mmetsp:Transcript_177890/g.564478  ORF Transcript_177890/g.564478 Transcript_177890/m.564478 type:complete len:228 (+) Transcript_177890:69-752(+)
MGLKAPLCLNPLMPSSAFSLRGPAPKGRSPPRPCHRHPRRRPPLPRLRPPTSPPPRPPRTPSPPRTPPRPSTPSRSSRRDDPPRARPRGWLRRVPQRECTPWRPKQHPGPPPLAQPLPCPGARASRRVQGAPRPPHRPAPSAPLRWLWTQPLQSSRPPAAPPRSAGARSCAQPLQPSTRPLRRRPCRCPAGSGSSARRRRPPRPAWRGVVNGRRPEAAERWAKQGFP